MKKRTLVVVLLLAAYTLGMAERGAKYLIIAADAFTDIVQPLAQWRTKKGLLAKVVSVSQAGGSASAIQSYIRNAYNTWPVQPEFVVLVGGPAQVPPYNSSTDCPYGDMTGDYLMEISVGRLYATTARECSLQVNKVLAYEKPVWTGDTLWFLRGTTCVREDNSADDTIYWNDTRLAHGYWVDRGYLAIDSFSSNRGNNSAQVNAACSGGRTFLTYRGQGVSTWWSPFSSITPSSWTNGAKMPIAVGATCATMSLSPGESMYGDQFVRAGTLNGLGGAIAYFGTTGVISRGAFYRSAVFRGFFTALFGEKNVWLGPATVRGRYRVDSLYRVQARYQEWNLFGDPGLLVWTGRPMHPQISYDSVIPLGPQTYSVVVRGNGTPVQDALVCLMMDTTVYATALTNGAGEAQLSINPPVVGTLYLTITGANLLPFETTVRTIVSGEPYLVSGGLEIDDFGGNNDQVANPGERLRLRVGLRNLGTVTATGVTAVLRMNQSGVTVLDSTATYGTVPAESMVFGESFELVLDTVLTEGQTFAGTVVARDSVGRSWHCSVALVVHAGRIVFSGVTLLDAPPGGNNNGRLGRGESGRLELAITNTGGAGLGSVRAVVRCLNPDVVLTDSTSWYGTLSAGGSASGAQDRLALQAPLNLVRNQPVTFRAFVWADGGTYHHWDTFEFQVQGEQGVTSDPTGPDAYGYWCYDNTDIETGQAPTYSWFDISSLGTVIPAVSDSDAATRALTMPFTFRYYGRTGTTMSACSNGWLCFGTTTSRRGTNNPMPDTGSAAAMIAPFWDDLNPDENNNGYGTAYQYYDVANHRWIVQYQDFAHINQPNIRETFQVIFYDPAYHPTPTGDGEIVFQYNRVSLNSSCTVGIEDSTETIGLQYLYNNSYAPTAAYLQAGRALKFTTYPPSSLTLPWLVLNGVTVSDALYGNNNGVAEPNELLTVVVDVRNSGAGAANNISALLRAMDSEGTVADSTALLGDIAVGGQAANTAEPFTYRVAALPGDSVAELGVVLSGSGYSGIVYFSFGLGVPMGVTVSPEQVGSSAGFTAIWPNPAVRTVRVNYGLSRAATVQLGLFDPTGRRVLELANGQQPAGQYGLLVPIDGLSQGVYFCRLVVTDRAGSQEFARKLQVAK